MTLLYFLEEACKNAEEPKAAEDLGASKREYERLKNENDELRYKLKTSWITTGITKPKESLMQGSNIAYLLPYKTMAGTKEYLPVLMKDSNLPSNSMNVFSDMKSLDDIMLDGDDRIAGQKGLTKTQAGGIVKNMLYFSAYCAFSVSCAGMLPPEPTVAGVIGLILGLTGFFLGSGLAIRSSIKKVSNIRYIRKSARSKIRQNMRQNSASDVIRGIRTNRYNYFKDCCLYQAVNGLYVDGNPHWYLAYAARQFLNYQRTIKGPGQSDTESIKGYQEIIEIYGRRMT